MRGDLDNLRPQGDRITSGRFSEPELSEREPDLALPAAAAGTGRFDAINPAAMLGLQRAAGNAAVAMRTEEDRSLVHEVVNSGGGCGLDPATKADMEARFGTDFSDVKVHTDGKAHESAKSVNAHAYTVGPSIVFQRDKFDPSSPDGRLMLAHELTHVVQQRNGPVDGTDAGGGVKVSDPSDRFEREAVANAERVTTSGAPAPADTGPAHSVQRCGADCGHAEQDQVQRMADLSAQRDEALEGEEEDEEAMAQTFVQREDEEEEAPEEE